MSSLRDKVASSDDASFEDVPVPEWGVTVRVVPPTVTVRSQLLKKFPTDVDQDIDYDNLYTSVLIATCHDPETGALAFTDDDVEMLLGKNGSVVGRLFDKCKEVCGFDAPETIEQGKGGS